VIPIRGIASRYLSIGRPLRRRLEVTGNLAGMFYGVLAAVVVSGYGISA
jgi:hypothetical protein